MYGPIIIVTGTRKATEKHGAQITEAIEGFLRTQTLIHLKPFFVFGGAIGVDLIAEAIVDQQGHKKSRIPYFKEFGQNGGRARNYAMLWHALGLKLQNPETAVFCLAFPTESKKGGTRHMMRLCRDFGIQIFENIIIPEGITS